MRFGASTQRAGDRLNPLVGCHQHLLPFIGCASKIEGVTPPTPAEMKAVSDCMDVYRGLENHGTPSRSRGLVCVSSAGATWGSPMQPYFDAHTNPCERAHTPATRARKHTRKHNTTSHNQVMMIFSMIDEDENGVIDQTGMNKHI